MDLKGSNNLERHLKMDFNDSSYMNTINRLFNKVVVDYSTAKFF